MKKILLMLCGALLSLNCVAASHRVFTYEYEGNQITYILNVEDKTCYPMPGTENEAGCADNHITGDLVIPSVVPVGNDSYTVDSIPKYSFCGLWELNSVKVPDTVTKIGYRAFSGSRNMKSITLGSGIESIEEDAFIDCYPEKVEFASIESLCNIDFANMESNPLDGAKLYIDGQETPNIIVPETIKQIKPYAFINCQNIETIDTGNSVTVIGERAFFGCWTLSSVIVGNAVTEIEECAFLFTGVKHITLGNSLTSIGSEAFYGAKLQSVIFPPSLTTIGARAFADTNLESIEFTESLTSIEDNTFHGCQKLKYLKLPNSLKSIGANAFQYCYALEKVEFGSSVEWVGEKAFNGCDALDVVEFPTVKSCCEINYGSGDANPLFYASTLVIGNLNTRNLKISDDVTYIGDYVFYLYKDLQSISMGNSVKSIGKSAFSGCTSLKSVKFGSSIEPIGDFAFSSCSNINDVEFTSIKSLCSINFASVSSNPLRYAQHMIIDGEEITDVVIPDDVPAIGNYAFYFFDSLKSVDIGNSVTSIGNEAFSWCGSLEKVDFGTSLVNIGNQAFEMCEKLESVTLPHTVTTIGDWAFYVCSKLNTLSLPQSLESIGVGAFEKCRRIDDIYYPGSNPVEADESIFDSSTYRRAYLHIDESATEQFKQTDPWKKFRRISSDLSGLYNVAAEIDYSRAYEIFDTTGKPRGNKLENLSPGLYIIRQGNQAGKILVR